MKEAREIVNIELQVIGSALVAVAEEMGAALIRSAFSSNIKERRDCSTAIFDVDGRMIAQAEHIPVHLGAMPEAVAAVRERHPGMGEVFAVNDPYTGGTHLPDITLVSRTVAGFAVSRAHHADVGGMEPSSLPAGSKELYQEGVIIPPTRLDDQRGRGLLVPVPRRRVRLGPRPDPRARHALVPGALPQLDQLLHAGHVQLDEPRAGRLDALRIRPTSLCRFQHRSSTRQARISLGLQRFVSIFKAIAGVTRGDRFVIART